MFCSFSPITVILFALFYFLKPLAHIGKIYHKHVEEIEIWFDGTIMNRKFSTNLRTQLFIFKDCLRTRGNIYRDKI